MPTPPELIEALRSATLFDPASGHPDHTLEQLSLYQLYLDLTELDLTKVQKMIEKHELESEEKLKLRQKLAAAFNLIPSILSIMRNYLFGEEPVIEVGDDPDLKAFLGNCDGNGTGFVQYVRDTVFPMAMALGMVDTLVQNPLMDEDVRTEADAKAAGAAPRVFTVLPQERVNWASDVNDAYHWITFKDRAVERPSPFSAFQTYESYITLARARALEGVATDKGVWVRSTQGNAKGIEHIAGYTPTERVPIATMYYRKSNDPKRRHYGLSKIALMAVLTKCIIQVLSWTHEDILANLAVLYLPVKGGKEPQKDDGSKKIDRIHSFTILWLHHEAKFPPGVVQGNVSHIEVKLKLIETYTREILRLAHMIGVDGEGAGREKSGFHAVVNRTELFQELADMAASMDRYALDVLALVKSWASGEDWDRERLINEKRVSVTWYKGPYTIEPVEQVLKDAAAAVGMFRDVSPTLVENQFIKTARAVMYQDDPQLKQVIDEIKANTGSFLAMESVLAQLGIAASISGERASSQVQGSVKSDLAEEAKQAVAKQVRVTEQAARATGE